MLLTPVYSRRKQKICWMCCFYILYSHYYNIFSKIYSCFSWNNVSVSGNEGGIGIHCRKQSWFKNVIYGFRRFMESINLSDHFKYFSISYIYICSNCHLKKSWWNCQIYEDRNEKNLLREQKHLHIMHFIDSP